MGITRKYFGTDGVRGRVGKYPITPDFVLKLAFAYGKVCGQTNQMKRVLVGKDTRISGYMFESAFEAGLSAAGINTYLLGVFPTPAIAFLTRTLRAEAGVVISASHNQYYDNGIKFFSSNGLKLHDNIEFEIEKYIDLPFETNSSDNLGKATRIVDAPGRYIEYCKGAVPKLCLDGLTVVLDCANGATYKVAPSIFKELGAKVIQIGVSPDGFNINHNCGSTHPELLVKTVLEEKADVGIGFDGDGDRVILVDHLGELVDGDEVLWILANDYKNRNLLNGGIVGTLMTNLGAEIAFRDLGVEFVRTSVGDRYVMASLMENGWVLGGESSGHILMLDISTTGDGILSALKVINAMHTTDKTLNELKRGMMKFPQVLVNAKVSEGFNIDFDENLKRTKNDAEKLLGEYGRVIIRSSGTEPVVRIMVEGENEQQVLNIAQDLKDLLESN